MGNDIVFMGTLRFDELTEQQQKEIVSTPDEQIWQRFKAGSDLAFEVLYLTHNKGLFHYGMKIFQNEDFVWDTIQDLFIDLWDSRDRLSELQFIKPYLFKALRNKLLRNVQKRPKMVLLPEEENSTSPVAHMPSEEHTFEDEEHEMDLQHKLKLAFEQLPKKQQEILYLRYYDGLATREISEITGIKYRTVNYLIKRALEKLNELGGHTFLFLLFGKARNIVCA